MVSEVKKAKGTRPIFPNIFSLLLNQICSFMSLFFFLFFFGRNIL